LQTCVWHAGLSVHARCWPHSWQPLGQWSLQHARDAEWLTVFLLSLSLAPQLSTANPHHRQSAPPSIHTTEQCANAAFGVCQATAISPQSPCAWAFKGTGQCTEGDVKT
jgi:hypothetical protein